MPNIADAGYGSEENYLYAVGEDQEPRIDFLIPYATYMKVKTEVWGKASRSMNVRAISRSAVSRCGGWIKCILSLGLWPWPTTS